MRERRHHPKRDRDLANGPGKLTIAMGITRDHNGLDVTNSELLVCEPAAPWKFEITTSTRIGIQHNTDWEMRFFIAGNEYVSQSR
jgi:DNA-3-methyladenine glycosylase